MTLGPQLAAFNNTNAAVNGPKILIYRTDPFLYRTDPFPTPFPR